MRSVKIVIGAAVAATSVVYTLVNMPCAVGIVERVVLVLIAVFGCLFGGMLIRKAL